MLNIVRATTKCAVLFYSILTVSVVHLFINCGITCLDIIFGILSHFFLSKVLAWSCIVWFLFLIGQLFWWLSSVSINSEYLLTSVERHQTYRELEYVILFKI
jgi:hypothetical protein